MEMNMNTPFLSDLRTLALHTCTKDPKTVFGVFEKEVYRKFFRHYIKPVRNTKPHTYGFCKSPFSTLVARYINREGKITQPGPMNLFFYRMKEECLNKLVQHVGDRVKHANVTNTQYTATIQEHPGKDFYFLEVDDVTKAHFEKYGFNFNSALQTVLNWKNEALKATLRKLANDTSRLRHPYCFFLLRVTQ